MKADKADIELVQSQYGRPTPLKFTGQQELGVTNKRCVAQMVILAWAKSQRDMEVLFKILSQVQIRCRDLLV